MKEFNEEDDKFTVFYFCSSLLQVYLYFNMICFSIIKALLFISSTPCAMDFSLFSDYLIFVVFSYKFIYQLDPCGNFFFRS
ncbi:unnamed protein product [Camellia sinensis]